MEMHVLHFLYFVSLNPSKKTHRAETIRSFSPNDSVLVWIDPGVVAMIHKRTSLQTLRMYNTIQYVPFHLILVSCILLNMRHALVASARLNDALNQHIWFHRKQNKDQNVNIHWNKNSGLYIHIIKCWYSNLEHIRTSRKMFADDQLNRMLIEQKLKSNKNQDYIFLWCHSPYWLKINGVILTYTRHRQSFLFPIDMYLDMEKDHFFLNNTIGHRMWLLQMWRVSMSRFLSGFCDRF